MHLRNAPSSQAQTTPDEKPQTERTHKSAAALHPSHCRARIGEIMLCRAILSEYA
eukprot:CAMPEP_0203863596 /NCGR_PEP_ID=MMETSP0359-20131031/14263_1 /ASSEMBLY_ACC=CAM_ASM_000338 /TAXON_ID=268821 /ORGANISM="Scrippsiella Hangoei, Strain SHTV-5" /LENGTH=54 /DNA_ID=CAMNT_0050781173 /DNA_START=142 /DNA_END=302 /DNA_ORIENTATION=-